MKRAHRATPDVLLSAGFSLTKRAWLPSYPEVTGYAIPTFLKYDEWAGDYRWEELACAMGEGLLQIQNPDGSYPGGFYVEGRPASVFNTGQILMGLSRLYERTRQAEFGRGAERAARWLVSALDGNGAWRRGAYLDRVHTYYVMVAWALLEWHSLSHDPSCRNGALRHVDWVLRCCRPNGWIEDMSFDGGPKALTHTIGYTLQGLLECARGLDHSEARDAAQTGAEALHTRFLREGGLSACYGPEWEPSGDYSCLTGNCQIALVWLELARDLGRRDLRRSAETLLRRVAQTQDLESPSLGIRGGIKGSHPIWGEYQRYTYPSWASKFFSDAILFLLREDSCGSSA